MRSRTRKLIGLAAIPTAAAMALMGAVHASDITRVHAAVVNLDKAVELNGQVVPLGRQLAAEIAARHSDNISWTLADKPNADKGLRNGEYAAVVVIPQNFSAAATSFGANDAAVAEQATVDVSVSQNAPVSDAQLALQVARIAKDSLNATLTRSYLDNIYIGFNTMGEKFVTVADGAKQLATGAGKLAEGAAASTDGAGKLADGLDQASAVGAALRSGAGQLAFGADQLASGAAGLADGASQTAGGARQLADGIAQLDAQLPQLVSGVSRLRDGSAQLADQLPAYTAGVAQLYDGFAKLATQIANLGQLAGMDKLSPEQLAELKAQAARAAELIADMADQAGSLRERLESVIANPPELPDDVANRLAQRAVDCSGLSEQECADARQTFVEGVQAGAAAGAKAVAEQAIRALELLDPSTGQTIEQQINQVAQKVQATMEEIAALMDELPPDLGAQLAQLKRAVADARPLRDEGPALNAGAAQIAGGLAELEGGAAELPGGVSRLSAGASQLADGAGALGAGASQLATGARLSAAGTHAFADGLGQYTAGVDQAASGAGELADGLGQLSGGADELAGGLDTFATELAKGAKEVPSYDEHARSRLADVVARPIAGDDRLSLDPMATQTVLIVVLMLWLGAVAGFAVLPPIVPGVLTSSRPTWWLAAASIGPAAVLGWAQAAILGTGASMLLGLSLWRGLRLTAVLLACSTAFVLVNHALAAWGRWWGRAAAIAMGLLTAVAGVTSAIPGWFSALSGFSVATTGLEAARATATGGIGLTGSLGVLLLWASIAFGMGAWALVRRRQLSADGFLAATRHMAATT